MRKIVRFDDLKSADLFIDAVYEGGSQGHAGDDPINRLVGCGNQGGFRYVGSLNELKLCVLYSSMLDVDWPDNLDFSTGIFTYYGDNKTPGRGLHETSRRGNAILRRVFNRLHMGMCQDIPPFFVFTKSSKGRDVIFRGIAVPGAENIVQTEDLVAIWKTQGHERFQNYKATFTILNWPRIPKSWINDLLSGNKFTSATPDVWRQWVEEGIYNPLVAPKTIEYRTKADQIPTNEEELKIIETIILFFKNHEQREYAFEKCASEILCMSDKNINDIDLTRPWRDGGRDGLGKYRIGVPDSFITVDFAMEAKCKNLNSGVGIRETARLISRLRYRQFGVMITTSYVNQQAYKEIVEDQHPVLILSAIDIVEILIIAGYANHETVLKWLETNF